MTSRARRERDTSDTQPFGVCTRCGKYRWRSRKAAKACIRRMKGSGRFKGDNNKHLNAYECPDQPGWWHVGHIPTAILRGNVARDDFTQEPTRHRRVGD